MAMLMSRSGLTTPATLVAAHSAVCVSVQSGYQGEFSSAIADAGIATWADRRDGCEAKFRAADLIGTLKTATRTTNLM